MTATVTEKPAQAVTPKRTSRAARSAAQNGKPAPKATAKSTTAKPAGKTAPKPKAAPKDKGPSERDQRRAAVQALVDAGAEIIRSWKPAEHNGISRETAREGIRQALGYVPAECWSYDTPHPVLGVRDVGRPRPVAKPKG